MPSWVPPRKLSAVPPIGAPSNRGSEAGASLLVRPYSPIQLSGVASAGGTDSGTGVGSAAPTAVESAAAATPPSNNFLIASILCRPSCCAPLVSPRPIAGIAYYYAHRVL